MSTASRPADRRKEFQVNIDMRKQLQTLKDLQKQLALNIEMSRHSFTKQDTDQGRWDRERIQSLLDAELQRQFRNIWESLLTHRATPLSRQINELKQQNKKILENTTQLQALQMENKNMREEIQQIHKLMARISVGGSHFNSSSRAPLTEEFDI